MQQDIKLTNESSNTVFVDDVDVSKGVYAKNSNGKIFTVGYCEGSYALCHIYKSDVDWEAINTTSSLKPLINKFSGCTFYTIPDNKSIVTEREVTIADLKNTDHVGFVYNNNRKGHIIANSDDRFEAITLEPHKEQCNTHCGMKMNSVSEKTNELLRGGCKVIRFDNIKELYQWLAE